MGIFSKFAAVLLCFSPISALADSDIYELIADIRQKGLPATSTTLVLLPGNAGDLTSISGEQKIQFKGSVHANTSTTVTVDYELMESKSKLEIRHSAVVMHLGKPTKLEIQIPNSDPLELNLIVTKARAKAMVPPPNDL